MPGTGWTLCCACLPAVQLRHGLVNSLLDPHAGLTAEPVREHAHAVACAEYVIQPVVYLIERNTEINPLRHLVRWLDIQGQLGHDAKSAERDHRAAEMVSIDIPTQLE